MPLPFIQKPTISLNDFKTGVTLPYGLTIAVIKAAMEDVYETLSTINSSLVRKGLDRLEETLLANSFSGILSELIVRGIAAHSQTLTRNAKVGGHPDLIPADEYPGNSVLRGEGIEVKASTQRGGWQGHNPEESWIMIFQYNKDTTTQPVDRRSPSQFRRVMLAKLGAEDWSFSGRKGESRRTPTASILRSGTAKLLQGTIYQRR